jgi:hypothetical protein
MVTSRGQNAGQNYMVTSRGQNAGQNHNLKRTSKPYKSVAKVQTFVNRHNKS